MFREGIRITDLKIDGEYIQLKDILSEVINGKELKWAITDLWAIGNLGEGKSIPELENQIRSSETGVQISWSELIGLSEKFDQIIDLVLIGDHDISKLHYYNDEQEMYETCDVVIVMFDSFYWEIFSADTDLINRLALKFHAAEQIRSDKL